MSFITPTPELKDQLWELCQQRIAELDITAVETVYQTDRCWEKAPDLLADICGIVGFAPSTDD